MGKIKKGDLVKFNNRYWVSAKNKRLVLKVNSDPFKVSDTLCVLLEGRSGGFAIDGLEKVD